MKANTKKNYAYFLNQTDADLVNKEKDDIKYIKKKTFKDAVDDGLEYRIVGRTRLKDADDDDDDRTILEAEGKRYIIDSYKYRRIKGYIPVGEGRYVEYVGMWNPLILLLLAILAALLAGILLYNRGDDSPILPDGDVSAEIEEEDDDDDDDLGLSITLPDGDGHFSGTVYEPEDEEDSTVQKNESTQQDETDEKIDGFVQKTDPAEQDETDEKKDKDSDEEEKTRYTGQSHIKVTLDIDGVAHTLVDYDSDIKDGEIPDFTIDFTILDFELIPGVYDGTVYITYPDGTVVEKPIQIVLRNINSGTMDISFSPDVTVDLSGGTASCQYTTDSDDTHDTVVELVIVKDDQEYVAATSDKLNPGDSLTSMKLDTDMKKRLSKGQYNGYLRLYFSSAQDDDSMAAIHTDIEVSIAVQ